MPSPFSFHHADPDYSPLRGGDGPAGSTALLPAVEAVSDRLGLLDGLGALGKDELNVARVRHVRVDLHFALDMSPT